MIGLGLGLVLAQLADILVAPRIAVLGVVDDAADMAAVVMNVVHDVGAGGALLDTRDAVLREFGLKVSKRSISPASPSSCAVLFSSLRCRSATCSCHFCLSSNALACSA